MLYRKWTQWSKHANSSPSGISLGLQQLLGKEAHSISLFVRAKYCVKCQRCKLHCLPVFPPIIVSTWSTPSQLRTSSVFSKTIFWDTQTRTRSLELILQRCQTLSVTCDWFRTGTHCIRAHVIVSHQAAFNCHDLVSSTMYCLPGTCTWFNEFSSTMYWLPGTCSWFTEIISFLSYMQNVTDLLALFPC